MLNLNYFLNLYSDTDKDYIRHINLSLYETFAFAHMEYNG